MHLGILGHDGLLDSVVAHHLAVWRTNFDNLAESMTEVIEYVLVFLYWTAFTYMVYYFAGYAKNDAIYRILASVALVIITTLLTLDIYYYTVK